jgi:hypothetical protein
MLTTQIGPPNLTLEYSTELRRCLEQNLNEDAELEPLLVRRTGHNDLTILSTHHFDDLFRLAMPKELLRLLLEEDWYVEPNVGIALYEIEREWKQGTYKMLHLVMDVRRQNPDRDHRFARDTPQDVVDAYRTVVRAIFGRRQTAVTNTLIDQPALQSHLDRIKARRAHYLGEG